MEHCYFALARFSAATSEVVHNPSFEIHRCLCSVCSPIERSFRDMAPRIDLISLQPEIAQSRMLIRTPAQRRMIFSLRFFDRKIVDARVPASHQSMFIKFPILVAV